MKALNSNSKQKLYYCFYIGSKITLAQALDSDLHEDI